MSSFPKKLKSLRALVSLISKAKQSGRTVVFTNGCFDLLHAGHVRCLKEARSLGDLLVVGLNRDASVRRLKGRGRPVMPEKDRAEVLSALECVDYLVFFSEQTPEKLIRALCPDFLVKGGDWKKGSIAGAAFVRSYGGKVSSLGFANGYSTTAMIKKIKKIDA